jgi:hypothetical protein
MMIDLAVTPHSDPQGERERSPEASFKDQD